MNARRWLVALVAFAPGCFHPVFDHPMCGPADACPPGQACNLMTGFCEAGDGGVDPGDAMPGSTDAQLCFGSGLVTVCLSSAPSRAVSYPTDTLLDTTGSASCTQTMAQAGGPELCILAGTTVTIGGTLTVIGSRALVLVAADSLTVSGAVDASSTSSGRLGAAANQGSCVDPDPIAGADDTGGAGGGAGGGLGTKGGTGGTGDLNDSGPPAGQARGGVAGPPQALTVLRGGCRGGDGGAGDLQHRSPGGDGGGAVYLIAGTTIHLSGDVFASGAGGGATQGGLGSEQGGGGGGAGGMIGLDAPGLEILGRVAANGGAGGGGGGEVGGSPGGDGTTASWNTPATGGTGGGSIPGGNGAPGTAIGATSNVDGSSNAGGAGGGAGGLGIIVVHGAMSGGTKMSPAPTAR
ncbi:MAG TPA: hypothetical protein VHT91_03670 [Kofleriaceae bacterium]|nr:hypothetical protein [Kofleriaceae bacterium]